MAHVTKKDPRRALDEATKGDDEQEEGVSSAQAYTAWGGGADLGEPERRKGREARGDDDA